MVGAKALKGHSHKLASFHTTKLSITVSCKGDVLYSTTTRIWVPIFYWCVVRCGSKNVDVDQKDVCLKGDWTTCSKYVHHSKSVGPAHDWQAHMAAWWAQESLLWWWIGYPYELRKYAAKGYGHGLLLLIISLFLHVSYPTRSGCKEKSVQITHV